MVLTKITHAFNSVTIRMKSYVEHHTNYSLMLSRALIKTGIFILKGARHLVCLIRLEFDAEV